MKRFIGISAVLAMFVGCSHISQNIPDDGVMSCADVTWPQPNQAWIERGTYPNFNNLAKVESGMNKDQIRELISFPQFNEGFYGVREWDYVFNLKEKAGDPDKFCQYKIIFDKDYKARSFFFKPEGCLNKEPAKIELSRDFLFDFDSATLKLDGKAKIAEIYAKNQNFNEIKISGFTDYLGSESYNMALSQKRAESVKAEFVKLGADASKIEAIGKGESEQIKACKGKGEALKACLEPNRRVVIDVK